MYVQRALSKKWTSRYSRKIFNNKKCFKALKTTKDTSKYISMYVQSWQGSLIYSKCGISLYSKKNILAYIIHTPIFDIPVYMYIL